MSELSDALEQLRGQLDSFGHSVGIDAKRVALAEQEGRMNEAGFWDDQEQAQSVIRQVKSLHNVIDPYTELEDAIIACAELLELAEAEDDQEALVEIQSEIEQLQQAYDRLEIRLALSGPYDASDVYLVVQAGAGGVESMDWAGMLVRMYSAYCQRAGYGCEVVDMQPGEEAGVKSATLQISGDMVYGYFKSEMGTHRLVRMSPFNAQGKRQTSFAAVEVTPALPESETVDLEGLDEKDFRIDTYRASGAGGQHVNKTDSAVRITHLETNVVVSCQSERSQQQNKARCWKMMASKLQQLKDAERLEELQALQGERGTIGWGHQIRSYVLQPTQLITDMRSRHKEGNAQAVLDGDLQPFIDAYLRWRLQQGATT
ncbi:MAG: peptide chain release factor 2 [Planctomycetota bacterium]